MVIFASTADLILEFMPVSWQNTGIAGVIIRAVCVALSGGFGVYLGFKLSLKLFDKKGTIIIKDSEIILKKGKREQKTEIKDILEVRKDMFAKFDGLRYKDTKAFGPLYTKHSIITEERELFALASVAEGWEKAGREVFGRENPVPIYSIDTAFKELAAYVDGVNTNPD